MIKRISELNNDELRKVFQENDKLQNEVEDHMTDSEMFYVSDNLNKFKKYLKDWNIGFYHNNNYIQVKEGCEDEFIKGVFDATKDYGFLSDEEVKEWEGMFYVEDSEYNKNLFKKFVNLVLNRLNEMTNISNYNIEDYFVEFYADAIMNDESFYINYETFELFEVTKKSYK